MNFIHLYPFIFIFGLLETLKQRKYIYPQILASQLSDQKICRQTSVLADTQNKKTLNIDIGF